jgi:hypothetical protein
MNPEQRLATSEVAEADRPPVVDLLTLLIARHPQLFYKPLFSLVASNKPSTIRAQLAILRALARLLKPLRLYFRDAEMMSVALFSNHATVAAGDNGVAWSCARIGQQALLLEVTAALRTMRTGNLVRSLASTPVDAV